jgi:phage antirepressor YoqD-like protein
MPKQVLAGLSEREGEPLETLIPRIVNEEGSQKVAAKRLNVSEMTLSDWLRKNGYIVIKKWIKPGEQHQCSEQGA